MTQNKHNSDRRQWYKWGDIVLVLGRSSGQVPQGFHAVRREVIACQFHKESCQKLDLINTEEACLGVHLLLAF